MLQLFTRCRRIFSSAMWGLALIGALIPLALRAAPATLATDGELRAERYIDAAVLSRLAKGSLVETLQSEAGWVQVRAGSNTGWLRASQLTSTSTNTVPPKKPEDGRNGPGNVMAISGIRSMPRASRHAGSALSDINEQRDTTRHVSVAPGNPVLTIGRDALDLSITSSHSGYLYLILLGSDNTSFYMLFPNDLDQDNAIKTGKALKLPRRKWEIQAQGPVGTDRLLAVVTDSPRDLHTLGMNKFGPFLTIPTDADGRPDLQWLVGTPAQKNSHECRHAEQQHSQLAQQCIDVFGSTLIDIAEQ